MLHIYQEIKIKFHYLDSKIGHQTKNFLLHIYQAIKIKFHHLGFEIGGQTKNSLFERDYDQGKPLNSKNIGGVEKSM